MNGFVRTLIFGMAMLGMLLVGGLTALLFLLSSDDAWRDTARAVLLSEDEKRVLNEVANRPLEPPRLDPPSDTDLEQITVAIANQIGRGQIRQLVEELRLKQAAVDDVRANLEREEAEIRLARSDLRRMQIQIEEQKRDLAALNEVERTERAREAAMQAKVLQAINALNEHQRKRYAELAKVYEVMKGAAWLQLRQMEPNEIARILHYMTQKRAAAILAQAVDDAENPEISMRIHEALLSLDVEGATETQVEVLADLYSFMKAETVMEHIAASSAQEVASLLLPMQTKKPKLVGKIMELLRQTNDPRELRVRELLHNAEGEGR